MGAQSKPIAISWKDQNVIEIKNSPQRAESVIDAKDQLDAFVSKLRLDHYITASIDTFYASEDQFLVEMFLGSPYQDIDIRLDSIDKWILDKSHVSAKDLNQAVHSGAQFDMQIKEILKTLENNGYPLASVRLANVEILDQSISADLLVDQSSLIKYDSLNIIGNLNLSTNYLKNYLGLKTDDVYNQEKLLVYRDKLQELSFLKIDANPSVSFLGDRATINLPLSNRPSSRFDFLIGLLPREDNGGQRFTLAMDLTADLLNQLGYGEHFYLQFRRLRPETQELTLDINYPYILDLPFGIELGLDIFRNANEYLELDFDIGWQYYFDGSNHLKAFWNLYSSRLLDIDTDAILQTRKLPDQLDVQYNAFGLQLEYEQLDYKFNPRQGFAIDSKASIGIKEVVPSLEIIDLVSDVVDFSSSYDSLADNSIQYRLEFVGDYFLPLGDRSTFKTAIHSGLLLSKNKKYQNEFFRIGGNLLLRGFDEESIFSSMYHVLTLEYRLLLSRNSYLSAFGDYGLVKNEFKEDPWDQPYGVGAGLNFETTAGIFGISVANGSQGDIPFNFRNAKIHFGFQSIF